MWVYLFPYLSTYGALENVCKGLTILWHIIICPKDETKEWHARNFLFGHYED
jgi:hypothetical protein